MKKILLCLLSAILVSLLGIAFAACGDTEENASESAIKEITPVVITDNSTEEDENLTEISGITFENYSCNYDSTEKSVSINGTLPEGVSVVYENNEGTNAGTYRATATLSGEGYKTKVLTATLTINKISYDMSNAVWNYENAFDYDGTNKSVYLTGLPEGVSVEAYSDNSATNAGTYSATATFSYDIVNYFAPVINACDWIINKANFVAALVDQSVNFDDEFHLPQLNGELPNGTTTSYYIDEKPSVNGVSAIGKYAAKVVLTNPNYNDLTLSCLFKIKVNAAKFAKAVVDAFGNVPNPWSFLPKSFSPSYHTIASTVNYDDFVNVSAIPVNGIGKQLNVVYGVLNKATTAVSYVNEVYKVLNAVETAYITFLDDDPDNYYKSFTFEKGSVSLTLETQDTKYSITATVSGFNLTVFANADGSLYGAKINLSSSNTLKYTVAENSFTFALNVMNVSATYIEFVRDNNGKIKGYIHEASDVADNDITLASALLEVGEDYTTIVGTKGDFVVPVYGNNRNCETYSNSTGNLVGTEVRETLKPNSTTEYTTLWYNLYSITGISSIKKIDEKNGSNPATIYINENTDTIHTKLYGGISLKAASRRFDIEFKTMYFYQLNQENNEYEKITYEIPMMFIQEEHIGTFETDFEDKNSGTDISLNVSADVKSAVNYGFYTLVSEYDEIRDTISFDDIVAYCNS